MFVQSIKIFLEEAERTTRLLIICSSLFLIVQAAHGGDYQRTRDGKTLVWNNFPSEDDIVSWTGSHDADGYATGKGTLTWYRKEKEFQTGSLLPSKPSATVVTRYSGMMVRGKLNGPVINVDPNGKTTRMMFVDGIKNRRPGGQGTKSSPNEDRGEHRAEAAAATPAEGPSSKPATDKPAPKSTPSEPDSKGIGDQPIAKATPSPVPDKPTLEIAALRTGPSTPPPAPQGSNDLDAAVKERIIADFKDETQSVLSQVSEATGNFRGVERLDSVGSLPAPVSDSVNSLVQRARDFRSKVGYETALREYRSETETVDALSAVNLATRSIAANDSAAANAKLTEFLRSNPEPAGDSERALWQYLASVQQLCSRAQKDAEVHVARAESFAAASRPSEAIREYQEAYRIFPNPATAERIHQLQANSLGL